MSIQWYPGHMHKARKQIKELLPKIDLIIEVMDARIPFSSQNPLIAQFRGNKPCIKVLTKTDLADPEITRQWQQHLDSAQGIKTFATTTQNPQHIRQLLDLCRKLLPAKAEKSRSIHALIAGIPNAGKSTLINTLAGKNTVKTGNEPAVTKGQHQVNLRNGITLWDTPGMLWPKIENENSGYRLAASGAIKVTAIDYEDIAFFVADYLLKTYPQAIEQRYEITGPPPENEADLLAFIARKRGGIKSGGRIDYHKAAEILLNDLRSGILGRISLETPDMIAKEQQMSAEKKNR